MIIDASGGGHDFSEQLRALGVRHFAGTISHTTGKRCGYKWTIGKADLVYRLTDEQGPLNPADIQARLKPGASVWFCGPPAFGRALSRDLVAHGLAERHFHQELFQMR